MTNETMKDGERAAFEALWHKARNAWLAESRYGTQAEADAAAIAVLARATSLQAGEKGGESVGVAGNMPGTDGFTMAAFEASKVPVGTKLYTRATCTQAGATLTDEQIMRIAKTIPRQPWGVGSRREDILDFARALLAVAQGAK